MKIFISTLSATVLVLVAAAWAATNAYGSGTHGAITSKTSETTNWGHPGKAGAVVRTIHITAEDSMHFVPAQLIVKTGQTIKLIIANRGNIKHELVLGPKSEQNEHENEMQAMMRSGETRMMHADPNEVSLPPGTTRTLIWTFTKAGTYQYACHEPGHYAAGMYGTLTVVGKKS